MLNKIAKDSFFNITNLILSKSYFLFASFYLVRKIGVDGFGTISYLNTTILFVQSVVTLGMAVAITTEISKKKEDAKALSLYIRGVFSIFILTYSILLVVWLTNAFIDNEINNITISVLVGGFFASLIILIKAIVNGYDDFHTPTKASLLNLVLSIVSMYLLTEFYGREGALWSVLLFFVTGFFINYIQSKKCFRSIELFGELCYEDVFLLTKSLLPYLVATLSFGFGFWYSMEVLRVSSEFELGLHNIANQYFMLISFIPIMISQVMLPKMAKSELDISIIVKSLLLLSAFSMLISFVFMLFDDAITYIYGIENSIISTTFFFSATAAVLVSMQITLDNFNVATGKVWRHAFLNAIWLASLLSQIFIMDGFSAEKIMLAKVYSYLLRMFLLYGFFYNDKKVIKAACF